MVDAVWFQCISCRELGKAFACVIAEGAERAGLVCPSCGATSWLSAGSTQTQTQTQPQTQTPAPPGSFDALILLKVSALLDKHPPLPSQIELRATFDRLLSSPSWTNDAEHEQLLKSATVRGELPFAGGCYRAVLDVVRDEPRARAAQHRLLALAVATMSQHKDLGSLQGGADSRATRVIVQAVVVVAAVLGAAFVAQNFIDQMGSSSQLEQ